MATSTATAFRAALITALQGRSSLTGVQIGYGMPAGSLLREHMLLGAVGGNQEFRAIGAQHKFEEYEQTVHIGVIREGQQQQTCDERAFTLMAELEDTLMDDLTVGNTVMTAELSGFNLEPLASETTREARLTVTVTVKARI